MTLGKRDFLRLSFLFTFSTTLACQNGCATNAAFIAASATTHCRRTSFLPEGMQRRTAFNGQWQQRPQQSSTTVTQLFMQASNHTGVIGSGLGHHNHRESSTELSASFADMAASMGYKVYCDLDGVLVDFEKGVRQLLKAPSSKLVKGTMWKHIARANAFYEHLDWTNDGKRLWDGIRHLQPDILTGVPYPKSSRVEKVNWCKRELGLPKVNHVDMAAGCRFHESVNGNFPKQDATNIITCWSNNKHMECGHGS